MDEARQPIESSSQHPIYHATDLGITYYQGMVVQAYRMQTASGTEVHVLEKPDGVYEVHDWEPTSMAGPNGRWLLKIQLRRIVGR